jgi:hypothetical protein
MPTRKKSTAGTTGRTSKKRVRAETVATLDGVGDGTGLRVAGRIRHAGGTVPAANLRVVVLDKDIGGEQVLGEATTSPTGEYAVAYTDQQFRRTAAERRGADVFIRVFGDANQLLGQSRTTVNAGAEIRIDLDLGSGVFVVRGTVFAASGTPVAGLVARAIDRDLRREETLGQTTTGADGRFEISYTTSQFVRAEKAQADLVVRVFTATGEGPALTQSDTIFNAPASVDVRLTVPDTTTEIERYLALLAPLLDDVALAELKEDETFQDFTFLVNETGIPREHLELLVRAAREAAVPFGGSDRIVSHVPPSASSAGMQVWYGWFRQDLTDDREALLALPVDRLLGALKKSIAASIIPAPAKDFIQQLAAALNAIRARTVLAPAQPDQPASVGDVLTLLPRESQLDGDRAAQLAFILGGADTDPDGWRRIESEMGLPPAQLGDLQRALVMRRLADGRLPILTAALPLAREKDPAGELPALASIAGMRADDWRKAMTGASVPLQPGETVESLADQLERRTAEALPSDFLMAASLRVPSPDALTALLERGDVSDARADLTRLANRFDGLQLAGVFAREGSSGDRAKEAGRRLGLLKQVYALNPETDFLKLDYMPGGSASTELAWGEVKDDDRRLVLNVLKAQKRVQQLTRQAQDSERLMEAGYASATRFLEAGADTVIEATGLPESVVGSMVLRANEIVDQTSSPFIFATSLIQYIALNINSWISGGVSNTAIKDFFTDIPGFAELFGRQSVCRCEHCQSVLSPAAYFVDLMWWVENGITRKAFVTQPNHPFTLKNRRPDLWNLPLTCANTDGLVPTLDIVNEVLERYIARLISTTATAADVYTKLAVQVGSLEQPFNLPLARIDLLLGHFKRSRADVARVLGEGGDTYARARFALSMTEWDAVHRSRATDTAFLRRLFGDTVIDNVVNAKPVDVHDLIARATWNRADLGELLTSATVRDGVTVAFDSRKSSSDSVQNDLEVVTGLTAAVLDRLHRFRRLTLATGWTPDELDLVLDTLNQPRPRMTAAELVLISELLDLQSRFGIEVDEVCALAGPISRVPLDGNPPLFDRLFNLQPFVNQQGPWPASAAPVFTHPAFDASGSSTPDNRTLQRLLAGLQVSDRDLVALLGGLGLASTTAPSVALTPENLALLNRHARLARLLDLTVTDLLALMRHAAVGQGTPRRLQAIGDVKALIDAFDDWQASGYSLDDVAFVLSGVPTRDSHPKPVSLTALVLDRLTRERPFEFSETIFASVEDVSEEMSRQIVSFNTMSDPADRLAAKPFEQAAGSSMFRLRAGVDPRAGGFVINVPATLVLKAATLAALAPVLFPYDPVAAIEGALASAAGVPREKLVELLKLCVDGGGASQPLSSNGSTSVAALYRGDAVGLRTALFGPRAALPQLLTLFDRPACTADAVAALNQGLVATPRVPVVFDSPTAVALTWRSIVDAGTYVRLAEASVDTTDPASVSSSVSRVRAALAVNDYTTAAGDAALAAALRTDVLRVASLRPHLASDTSALRPVARLDRLRSALEFAAAFGASGETLRQMVPALTLPAYDATAPNPYLTALRAAAPLEYASLARAADGLYGIIRTTYPDEKTFRDKVEPFDDISRGRQRDALVEFLLRPTDVVSPRHFRSTSDLIGFFLIDVETGGCSRTSRVVSASLSVQLYVQRVLMQLESAMWSDVADGGKAALDAVRGQWSWRKNYRVWEANRKVFLYPENDLEPDIRDDKTPIFVTLEDELFQQPVTETSVTDAYTAYLHGYETAANLRIAGAFHDVSVDPDRPRDILHLLGVTNDDPPVYYYRKVSQLRTGPLFGGETQKLRFGPWRKIDVQISATDASPAVMNGRLYIFWIELQTSNLNRLSDGENIFDGYVHRYTLRFTSLRPDGKWTPPQDVAHEKNGLPLVKLLDYLITTGTVHAPDFARSLLHVPPLEPMEGYTLKGQLWRAVSPEVWTDLQGMSSRLYLYGLGPGDTNNGHQTEYLKGEVDLFSRICKQYAVDPLDGEAIDHYFAMESGALVVRRLPAARNSIFTFVLLHRQHTRKLLGSVQYASTSPQAVATIAGMRDVQCINRAARGESHGFEYPNQMRPRRQALDVIFETDRHIAIGQLPPTAGDNRVQITSLGTSIRDALSRRVFSSGVEGLLSRSYQQSLDESFLPLSGVGAATILPESQGGVAFTGPFGTYFRELFFEIPYAIANQLNARQQFAAAQRWYHYIFDPTTSDTGPQRVWQYRQFIEQIDLPSLRTTLTEPDAIAAYQSDPFNPHAIARLRPGAHQRAIVMRYIDNLLDWGDSLFTEFTMESLNEATMLYILAQDLLGERPPDVGDCGEGAVQPRTYAKIEEDALEKGASDFLIELELWSPRQGNFADGAKRVVNLRGLESESAAEQRFTSPMVRALVTAGDAAGAGTGPVDPAGMFGGVGDYMPQSQIWRSAGGTSLSPGAAVTPVTAEGDRVFSGSGPVARGSMNVSGVAGTTLGVTFGDETLVPFDFRWTPSLEQPRIASQNEWKGAIQYQGTHNHYSGSIIKQASTIVPVFCVPPNKDLLAYWDRVEDRLRKIRNCMDIAGVSRRPSLFAPEIDPALLVRARAAGLSLDEAVAATSASVPPYRFSYLIERARQHVQAVQSLSSALLTAIDRKDTEELNQLRTVHEKNVLAMRRRVMQLEIDTAQATAEALRKKRDQLSYKQAYYAQLRAVGDIGPEQTAHLARTISSGLKGQEALFGILAGILGLLPQMGSPFAMTYGGVQVKGTAAAFLNVLRSGGALADVIAEMASAEAEGQRRDEAWQYEEQLAAKEILEVNQEIKSAEARARAAERSMEVHEKLIDQADELLDFYRDKFTSQGLFTWLSTRLHRLHREAFNAALGVAQMAERAFDFERVDDTSVGLAFDYWDAGHAGLGAADRLMLDLNRLEQRFLETNFRTFEVEQSVSLGQIDPQALVRLRATGTCTFSIPEVVFDIAYPGHYRRRMKAVRLTMPCVTGPYINVGATLRLTRSRIRLTPTLATEPTDVPLRHTTAIATSSAQNDAGVFEFNFRDERYMPFEGAGVISDWQIDLPSRFRVFDYESISDVILRLAYTAEDDGTLRTEVQNATSTSAAAIRKVLGQKGVTRMLSLRHDLPDVWRALVTTVPAASVPLVISTAHLPLFLTEWLNVAGITSPKLGVEVVGAVALTGESMTAVPTIRFDISGPNGASASLSGWAAVGASYSDCAVSNFAFDLSRTAAAATLGIQLVSAGNTAASGATAPPLAFDDHKLRDVLIVVKAKTKPA